MSGVSVKTLSCSKKGQGLSLNTIIIAIIVVIVLVVLVMIFTGYFAKIFNPTVGSCTASGGACSDTCNTGDLGNQIVGATCQGLPEGTKCCAKVKDFSGIGKSQLADCQTVYACLDNKKDNPECASATPPACCTAADSTNCAKVTATCADYPSKSDASNPGCPTGTICCK